MKASNSKGVVKPPKTAKVQASAKPSKSNVARSGGSVKPGSSQKAAAERRRVFVEAYITNGRNATEAAKTAGYSEKTAYSLGGQLLKHLETQQLLRERQESLAAKYELTTENVIAELAKIVHADLRKVIGADGQVLPIKEWPDDMAAAIAAIEIAEIGQDGQAIGQTKKIKLWDKNSAIEKAMKHLGLFEKDNDQKRGVADLSEEQLNALLVRKAQEAGLTLH